MLKNYFKTAIRNLIRNKLFSFINILGLAIGLAASILMLLYVSHELNYDKFHKDYGRIYRIAVEGQMSGDFFDVAVTPAPLAPFLKWSFPEVESTVRMDNVNQQSLFTSGDNRFYETDVLFADSAFFSIFDFNPIVGDLQHALDEPFSIVLTNSVAGKYFGKENPVGKVLKINDEHQFKVTAVLEDVPTNSHLKFRILLSWSSREAMGPQYHDDWGSLGFYSYVKLANNADPDQFEEKIRNVIMENIIISSGEDASVFENISLEFNSYLQPLTSIHLHSNLMAELSPNSDISYVYSFSAIALFILLIACINFMNLTTARSSKRAREVGIRKVLGSYKLQLIQQFLGEAVIISFSGLIFAILLVQLALPVFNNVLGGNLDSSLVFNPGMFVIYFLIALVVGLVAGSYPAFYLSSFQPIKVLKGSLASGNKNPVLRNILVVIQFSISIFLIIGTGIIYNQLTFVKNKRLGFDKEHIMVVQLRNDKTRDRFQVLENELYNLPAVKNVTSSFSTPGVGSDGSAYFPEGMGQTDPWLIFNNGVNYGYIETMGMEMLYGRNFAKEHATDTAAIIINETLLKKLGWGNDAIGKKMKAGDPTEGADLHVIGVVKDFHYQSLHDKIEPYMLYLRTSDMRSLSIKVNPGNLAQNIEQIGDKWNQLVPELPFEYKFLDETFDELYQTDENLANLFIYFSLIAIFIACLGLIGLATFTAEQKRKEIGIRKTFGASSGHVSFRLTMEFSKWIVLSNIIAWPLAFYFLDKWLQSFAFRIDLIDTWYIFVLSAVLSLLLAVLTIVHQTLKAANANPVEALKFE
nr:ABC transporter permease [Bacteroidota bacterium]